MHWDENLSITGNYRSPGASKKLRPMPAQVRPYAQARPPAGRNIRVLLYEEALFVTGHVLSDIINES